MVLAQREFNERMRKLAEERASAEAKWLDEGIAALIRAGVDPERISVQYWPQGKGNDPTPFSRVTAYDEPDKAIAAELRKWAEGHEANAARIESSGVKKPEVQMCIANWRDFAEQLRARADELDGPTAG
jgi:hypothetical protein